MQVLVDAPETDNAALYQENREAVREFEKWFVRSGNAPLANPEVSILMTFLWWASRVRTDSKKEAG